jgi:hypothetical protein
MEKLKIKLIFQNFPYKMSDSYGKNEKTASTASTEMNFIQKRGWILPNCGRRFKDESSIFSTIVSYSCHIFPLIHTRDLNRLCKILCIYVVKINTFLHIFICLLSYFQILLPNSCGFWCQPLRQLIV